MICLPGAWRNSSFRLFRLKTISSSVQLYSNLSGLNLAPVFKEKNATGALNADYSKWQNRACQRKTPNFLTWATGWNIKNCIILPVLSMTTRWSEEGCSPVLFSLTKEAWKVLGVKGKGRKPNILFIHNVKTGIFKNISVTVNYKLKFRKLELLLSAERLLIQWSVVCSFWFQP